MPGTDRWAPSPWVTFMNKVLGKLGSPLDLRIRFDHRRDMVSLEQIANLELLFTDLVDRKVPGAVVEIGCYMGSTAAVLASLLQALDHTRFLHVYDTFEVGLDGSEGIRGIFEQRMRECRVPMPRIHAGDVLVTIPQNLPGQIAFAHLDLGTGGNPEEHAWVMAYCLRHVYERLQAGGILVIMDYHVPGVTVGGNDSNPGTRVAVDAFLVNKPEKPRLLYGGPCSHAFIRKQ